jgi:hypothetical protein
MPSAAPRPARAIARAAQAQLVVVARRWPLAREQARASRAREQRQVQAVCARVQAREQTRAPLALESAAPTPAPSALPERWRPPMGLGRVSEPEPAQRRAEAGRPPLMLEPRLRRGASR